jgi:beta-N-acetylhexosaminidase
MSFHSDPLNDAYAVLLPAYDSLAFTASAQRFFANGGVAALLGCSRAEYVARRMSPQRQDVETGDSFRAYAQQARAHSGRNVVIAVDYEIGGVHRLHRLAPQLSHPSEALTKTPEEVEAFGFQAGTAARALGVNLILAPVLDAVSGENPWLLNRSLSPDPDIVAPITTAFIVGLQKAGVAATAKHFPGHHDVPLEPHDSAESTVPGDADTLAANIRPFADAVARGVRCVMTGPVPVQALDPVEPSSTSKTTVDLLRNELGFAGLVVSDDLDLAGTMRGRPIAEVALASLAAGVQLLLLSDGPQIDEIAEYIARAVQEGRLAADTLRGASEAVRQLADSLA